MISLIFPGQGSQFVGMGKEIFNNFKPARDVFYEVDNTLNKNLSKLIFEGPIEELTLTENAQPALMAVSIATLRTIEHLLGDKISSNKVQYVAGHSVGEYTSLCASGVLSLSETAKLLQARGKAMNDACKLESGGMLALLGGDINAVENVVALANNYGKCEIANDNGGNQIVVSGCIAALNKISELIKGTPIKRVIKLNVSGPFHSTLMDSAYHIMKNLIDNLEFNTPNIPLVSNILATVVSNPLIIKDVVAKQIISRVRWREMVLYMIRNKCTKFIEIGAGCVLSNLIKKIDNTVEVINSSSMHDMIQAANHLNTGNVDIEKTEYSYAAL